MVYENKDCGCGQGYSLKALKAYYQRSPFIVNSCIPTIMKGNLRVLRKG